jgi:trk system potassium uptake protein TrkH
MTPITVLRVLGLLLATFSLTMLPPVIFSIVHEDGTGTVFFEAFLIVALLGLRDGFLVVALFWLVLGLMGAVPFMLSAHPQIGFTDAVFESVSGLTTTGATVLTGLDSLPPALLYYRHQLQWFGGLGIIVLAVAVLPMLGVGGMQLYRMEAPGPVKDSKLTPKIKKTAKALWYIYVGITALCCLSYWAAGMSFFDALCHSFSTVAIGGFSTHDASIGHFDNPMIELVAVGFMLVAGVNFTLHFLAWRERSLIHYIVDPEFRAYFYFLGALTVIVLIYLLFEQHYHRPADTLLKGVFQAVSIATTTGYTTDNFALWPGALPVLLIFASFVGGCAGSTAGGMKVVRWSLIYRQGVREFQRLVHPNAEIPVRLGTKAVNPRVIDAVWGFFAVYVAVFTILILVMLATGLDHTSAFSAVAASLNNLGPGLGSVATGFGELTDVAKWSAVAAMLIGRLEIFTLLVLVTPTFWRG